MPVARKKTQTDSGGLQRVRIYCRAPGKGVWAKPQIHSMFVFELRYSCLFCFVFFLKGNNQEAGFSGLVTFSNHSFESQNVSGLGFPGPVVHDLVSDTHLALEKQSAFLT